MSSRRLWTDVEASNKHRPRASFRRLTRRDGPTAARGVSPGRLLTRALSLAVLVAGFAVSDAQATKEDAKQDPPAAEGCATSFLMQERGEIDKACGEPEPDPNEEYVQPDKEKEAGGEG